MHSDQQDILLPENINQLAEVVDSYPYYSIAQFRLLSAYHKNQDKYFEEQALKTALYFTNHKWLNWQLHNQNKAKNVSEDDEVNNTEMPDVEEHIENAELVSEDKIKFNPELILNENKEEELSFQPLYTVDYFASQGIQVSEETTSNDKLGTQLKSFTEWLKGMKKIHAEKSQDSNDESDKIIQTIAETSNTNGNVVTEAMAEVLIKQGKIESAIEMYNKLSLKNPAKSAYFVYKIQSLKQD